MASAGTHTRYLDAAVGNYRRAIVAEAIRFLRVPCRRRRFNTIAFMGMSGALVAPQVADALKCRLLMVRKPDDGKCHSELYAEGKLEGARYLIIDDFVSTGATIRTMMERINNEAERLYAMLWAPAMTFAEWKEKPEPVAVYSYSHDDTDMASIYGGNLGNAPSIPVWFTEDRRRMSMAMGTAPEIWRSR